ncbi:pectinesterase inhibitor 12-like [Juglans microcarpa x Juglans regia]|uniref:pectinesterase inhibitor 12-like n=1 Tax=Juglans microcarpa x Juglans regia TaxID=2249226 RepID=UPI001B7F170C|nr:pectinesterase inhibitor 12-like [Juglans microcarpa x Juglans regia]
MAIEHCMISFSLVFLATVTILLAGQARAQSLCDKADYQPLCLSVIKGQTDAHLALESAITVLISQSQRAKISAGKKGDSQNLDVCKENFDDAISNLKTSLKNLKNGDMASLNINLSAALTDFVTCDDTFVESSETNPIGKTDTLLSHMASNCLYLSSLIHKGHHN